MSSQTTPGRTAFGIEIAPQKTPVNLLIVPALRNQSRNAASDIPTLRQQGKTSSHSRIPLTGGDSFTIFTFIK